MVLADHKAHIVMDNAACIINTESLDGVPRELHKEDLVGIDGFLLVYSVKSRESFELVPHYYDRIIDVLGRQVPLVIVGNEVYLDYCVLFLLICRF